MIKKNSAKRNAAKPAKKRNAAKAAKPAKKLNAATAAKPAKKRNAATTAKPAKKRNAATTAKPAKKRNAATTAKPAKKRNAATTAKPAKKRNPTTTAKPAKQRNAKKRNAAEYSSSTPISVTHHFRSGGPGYATAREKIIRAGQRDLFAQGASSDELLGWLRKNPTVTEAVKNKLGKKFDTASPSLLKTTMRQVLKDALKKSDAKRRNSSSPKRRNPEEAPGALREAFLGRPSEGVDHEYIAPEGTPARLDELAPLAAIKYRDEAGKIRTLDFDKLGLTEQMVQATGAPVVLCGKRTGDGYDGLYLVNQPSLLTDEVRPGKLGELTEICYWAVKSHLQDKAPVLYWHPMGEETGVLPELHLDKEGFLKIRGGEYYIPRDDFNGHSSGIHN